MLLRKWEIRWCFVFPPHLSSISALPCDRGNPEGSALVLCACNTVQLLQSSRLSFSWTMPPNSSELNALITRFRASYTSVNTSRESKRLKKSSSDLLNSGNGLMQRVKNAIFMFVVLPGSAKAQASWGGVVKHLLIAYFIGSISAKNIKIRSHVSKL